MRSSMLWIAIGLSATPAWAALITTHVDTNSDGAALDGALGANEYETGNAYQYTGGGTGFGGTLGSGRIYMESDGLNLYVAWQSGTTNPNDNVVVYLNTRSGGFTDATMSDNADTGRFNASQLGAFGNDPFPTSPYNFEADFAIVFGNSIGSGTPTDFNVVFELTGGSLIALNGVGASVAGSGDVREASIQLSTLGVSPGGDVDFFAGLVSSTGFLSNESIPASAGLNGSGNPGFTATGTYSNIHRFTVIPEPASVALLALGFVGLGYKRRGVIG